MSVVTAVRNVRLSFARLIHCSNNPHIVYSIYWRCIVSGGGIINRVRYTNPSFFGEFNDKRSSSNNALISAAHSVSLAPDLVKRLTENPVLISQGQLNMTSHERDVLLAGYITGYRAVFLLNASLAAVAVVVTFFMIHHKELTREDDAIRKEEAREKEKR
jgi:hypothetical protein